MRLTLVDQLTRGLTDAPKIEVWPVDRPKPYERNARTHPGKQLNQLVASYRQFGICAPILADSRGVIVAGHGRQLAAKKAGLTEVPVIMLRHLSEHQARAYRIADNRIAEASRWDKDLLVDELARSRPTTAGRSLGTEPKSPLNVCGGQSRTIHSLGKRFMSRSQGLERLFWPLKR
jgi:hypothetical protein